MEKQKYEPKIITIHDDEDGKDYEFAELERIQYEDGQFIGLVPLDEKLRQSDDSFLVFRLVADGGRTQLQPIEDDALRDKVGILIQEYIVEEYDL